MMAAVDWLPLKATAVHCPLVHECAGLVGSQNGTHTPGTLLVVWKQKRPSPHWGVAMRLSHESPALCVPLLRQAYVGVWSFTQHVCPAGHCHGFVLHCAAVPPV